MKAKIPLSGDIYNLAVDLQAFGGRNATLAALLMALGGLLEGLGLAFLAPLFSIITQGQQNGGGTVGRTLTSFGVSTTFAQLALILSVFVLVMALRAAVLTARDRKIAALQFGYVTYLQVRLVRALGASHWQDVAALQHARITQALGADITRVGGATQLLLSAGVSAFMVVAQWLVTLLIAPKIAGLALVLAILGTAAFLRALKSSSALGALLSGGGLSMTHTTTQLLGGLKLSMAQNMQRAFVDQFVSVAHDLSQRRIIFQRRQSMVRVVITTASALAGAAILFAGFWWGTPIASLLASFAIFSRMNGAAVSFVQSSQQLANNAPSHTAVMKLLAELEPRVRPSGTAEDRAIVASPSGAVVFDKVSYGDGAKPRLAELDLVIKRGEVVGVTGASGAGKTTFVDLLTGLLTPDAGVIRIDGHPLDRETAHAWRNRISYVTQDSFLINDSIRQNLTWGQGDVDDESLWRALKIAGADTLVKETEAGLDTVVSERGARFSGGERQRVALARALLRRPEVLILDEATNAIDIETEMTIFDRIHAADPDATVIVVAHRPSTLELCDRVLTFEGGRLMIDKTTAIRARSA